MKNARKAAILVVDDTEANRYTLGRYLEIAGFEVWQGSTGQEALALASRGPELTLLDIKLPDLTGFEVCRRLKAGPKTALMPVLLISSALKSSSDKVHGLEAGADGYLTLPIEPDELLAHVQLLLRLRRKDEELRESEEEFRAMFTVASVGKAQADTDGRFLRVNAAFCAMTGYSEAELLAHTIDDITHPDDREADRPRFARLARGEVPTYEAEKRYVRPDGAIVWVQVTANMLRDVAGHPLRTTAVIQDITQRKQAEQTQRELSRELEIAHRRLEEHAAGLEARVAQRTAELARANAQLQAEMARREAAEQGRAALLRQLVRVQEDERRRVARELHDELGQHLTALSLRLKALKDSAPDSEHLRQFVPPLEELTNQMGQEVHRLALELRPTALDDVGLLAPLRNYVQAWSGRVRLPVDFQSTNYKGDAVAPEIETTLYRIVQEALNNVAKHARATQVSVILECVGDQVHAIIEDNGCGFDADAELRSGPIHGRLGLLGMRERLGLLGGSLNLESTPGNGTTVFARIPLLKSL